MAVQGKRGYCLSNSGWEKLWEAIHTEFPEGHGRISKNDEYDRYNLPKIAALTQTGTGGSVSDETISKIIHRTEKTDKSKIQSLFKAFGLQLQSSDLTQDVLIAEPIKKDDPNFVGRESAIADLGVRVAEGAKIILVHAAGGVGKTTLAKQYLKQRFSGEPLSFEVAKLRSPNATITSVDGEIKKWLEQLSPRDYDSNITFKEALKQLKEKLIEKPTGILIDNLEPALLDNGRFIEAHQESYLELLEVLYSPEIKSVTLITSRFKLSEPNLVRPKFRSYPLKALTWEDWKTYFQQQLREIIIDDDSIKKIHKYYYGNALAMELVSERVSEEKINLETYWQGSNKGNRVKPEQRIKNLVCDEFEFLKSRNQLAYDLLCRLSCYRYQEVPEIPYEAFECLFWNDETDEEKDDVIQYLLDNTAYINRGEQQDTYFLHPLIIEEGRRRIKQNKLAWEKANLQAAEFWTESVKTVESVSDALTAFEAYYHYSVISDFEMCGQVIVKERDSKWDRQERLGSSFYRIGLLDKKNYVEEIIEKLLKLNAADSRLKNILCRLYNTLGDLCWLRGELKEAIKAHDQSRIIAIDLCLNRSETVAYLNIGLCLLDQWELEESEKYFKKINEVYKNNLESLYVLHGSYFCLALINSHLSKKETALSFCDKFNQNGNESILTFWGKGYSLLFMGLTYKNLGNIDRSFTEYEKATAYAKQSNYTQVKAKALTGLGELYRLQREYQKAIDEYHLKSIEILDKIGAKCDLAEAYFQLALTYKAMGDQPNSQIYFEKALDLWGPEQIDAPKQRDRVNNAWLMGRPE